MSLIITHTKTNTIPDWDQQKLDAAISAGLYPQGTRLADIVLPSDWNASHTVGELSLTSCTFANLPSPASSYTGQQRIVTDCNNSVWFSNGTAWNPNGRITLFSTTAPVARAPSGTINTGSSGNLTLGTASSRVMSEGCWLELPSIATTPAIAAGRYWWVASSTTVGTLYTNGAGSAAYNFTVGAGYTGVTTVITENAFTIKGGVIGNYRSIDADALLYMTNNTNNKIGLFQYGAGTASGGSSHQNGASFHDTQHFKNHGTQLQIWNSNPASTTGIVVSSAVDSTADQTFSYYLQCTTATDWCCIEHMEVFLNK